MFSVGTEQPRSSLLLLKLDGGSVGRVVLQRRGGGLPPPCLVFTPASSVYRGDGVSRICSYSTRVVPLGFLSCRDASVLDGVFAKAMRTSFTSLEEWP